MLDLWQFLMQPKILQSLQMTELETENKIQSIGQILKEKRQESAISVADACAYLKVKKLDIDAVESDDFDKLSNHIYALGFVRSYAKFLKVEARIIEEKIKSLPIKSNVENKKHLLINIGEDEKFSPNREMFFNALLLSILLFLVLLSIFNSVEKNGDLITSEILIHELENTKNPHE